MLEFKYDTQLLIEGTNLDEDEINDYFLNNFNCASLGEIYDVVIEDMDRQARGLQG